MSSSILLFLSLFICCFLPLFQSIDSSTALKLYKIQNAEQNLAICNDGTPGAYYFRAFDPEISKKDISAMSDSSSIHEKNVIESFNNSSTNRSHDNISQEFRWHIHLQGGFWCWNFHTCKERQKNDVNMTTSKYLNDRTLESLSGIFSQDSESNPSFYNTNHVWVWYCSSDTWSGDTYNETLGFQFRGRRIIEAVLKELALLHGFGSAKEILLTGCSAGGAGVQASAEFIYQNLKNSVLKDRSFRFQILMDAGMFFDIPTLSKQQVSLGETFQLGQPLWNGIPDRDCVKFFSSSREIWKCYMSQYGLRFLLSRGEYSIFVQQSHYDLFQVWWNIQSNLDLKHNETQIQYARDVIGYTTLSTINELQTSYQMLSLFVPSCLTHCTIYVDLYWTLIIKDKVSGSNLNLSQSLDKWFSNSRQVDAISNCSGFTCTEGCPAA